MNALPDHDVTKFVAENLQEWKLEKRVLHRDFKFKAFVEAFSFITSVALEAEKMGHHPDWSNTYNSVSISLSTHEANGITQLDFDLANIIDQLYLNYPETSKGSH